MSNLEAESATAGEHQHPSRVVLLHGRDAALDIPETMGRTWIDALRYGLKRVDYEHWSCVPIAFPYYAAGWRPDEYFAPPVFKPGHMTEHGEVAAAQESFAVPNPGDIAERATEFFMRYLHLTDNILSLGLKDVEQYFRNDQLRKKTDDYVLEACAGADEIVMVGFSMGSIVGWHVLSDQSKEFPVKSFVTCGSPLVSEGFYDYVKKLSNEIPMFPPSLRMWANIWDDRDPATLDHDWTGRFSSAIGLQVQAAQSFGRPPKVLKTGEAHNPFDYLSSKALGSAVATGLRAAVG